MHSTQAIPADVPQRYDIVTQTNELDDLLKDLLGLVERAGAMADRVTGPLPPAEPPTAGKGKVIGSVPTNLLAHLQDIKDTFRNRLYALTDHLGRLDSAIG